MGNGKLPAKASNEDIQAFLEKVAATSARQSGSGPGRLIFALDATASREPTWDHACHIQGEMFTETALLGGLEINWLITEVLVNSQLRDKKFGSLLRQMTSVFCLAGETQFRKVLKHALNETKKQPVSTRFCWRLCEEDVDALGAVAGEWAFWGSRIYFSRGF